MSKPILLVEDTSSLQLIYASALRRAGHIVETANNGMQAKAKFATLRPDIVVLDLLLPDKFGLDVMRECLALNPTAQFIVVTSDGSINRAIEAMRLGANDYLVKPFLDAKLVECVANANTPTNVEINFDENRQADALTGSSQAILDILKKIGSVGRSMAAVFISGESGTGKVTCAKSIHNNSARSSGPLIQVNCGTFQAERLDSENYGQMPNSFQGAIDRLNARILAADEGTLVLNEICDLPKILQTKLLEFFQTSELLVSGEASPRRINLRAIAISSVNPWDAVTSGTFLEDLFYRLYVIPIEMPPLRDRDTDIVQIATRSLADISKEENRDFKSISTSVLEIFSNYGWPGNVRQLENTLRNMIVLNEGPVITPEMLADQFLRTPVERGAEATSSFDDNAAEMFIGKTLLEVERWLIEETIRKEGGSVPRAARILDVAPSTIYRKRDAWQN